MTENNSLVRKQLEESLENSSLKSLAREYETLMLLIDTSGSMHMSLKNGKKAIDVLREVVATVTAQGAIPMIAFGGPFGNEVRFVDVVPDPDGGTPLHDAISLAKTYGATRVVVISDGMPDSKNECLERARTFGQIDVVYVGREGDAGAMFLEELAQVTGGKRLQSDLNDIKRLTSTVIGLLDGDVDEPTILQGEGFTTTEAPDVDDDSDDDEEEEEDDEEDDETE